MDQEDLLSDLSLLFGDDIAQVLDGVPHELDFISPVCDKNEMEMDTKYKSNDDISFHYQVEKITTLLLEKALRGKHVHFK